jgi:hypothetical protein
MSYGSRDALKLLSFFCLVLIVGTRKIMPRSQDARKPGSGEVKGGAVLTVLWRLNLKPFDNPVQEFAVDDAQ